MPLSYIELSKKSVLGNIRGLRKLAGKNIRLAVAVKGNAYGHGQNEIVKIAQPLVNCFLVNSIEELRLLRNVSKKEVLILGFVAPLDINEAIQLGVVFSVSTREQLIAINTRAQNLGKKQKVHIALDAHLGREGVLLKDLPALFELTKKLTFVVVAGLYAHFANIEDTRDRLHAKKQASEYDEALVIARGYGYDNLITHISATSGLLAYEGTQSRNTMVRIGIGMYGLWPSEDLRARNRNVLKLWPVLSWKTHVVQVKVLPKGATIGYGLTYRAKKKITVALLPQGYADGYSRALSNKGEVLIGGKRCRVLGRVSMNMLVVDVSRAEQITVGDEAVLIGRQGKEEITAEELAELTQTINYEVVTRISPLLPRVVS